MNTCEVLPSGTVSVCDIHLAKCKGIASVVAVYDDMHLHDIIDDMCEDFEHRFYHQVQLGTVSVRAVGHSSI